MLRLPRLTRIATPVVIILLFIALPVADISGAVLAATAPSLGTAANFAVLGASTVTNTGGTVVEGDLGVSPGSAVTGFPPGIVVGTIHIADAVALQAQSDANTAYNTLAGQACDLNLTGQDLGGLTLDPGVYCFDSSAQLTGILTLDAQGDPDAVWIFQMGSTLTTASNSSVVFINSESDPGCNLFWQVGSSATLGTTTAFAGDILAYQSITLNTGASLEGRALALNGAVTMDTNAVSIPVCEAATASTSGTVWNDLNGDGVKDDGEPGLEGWTIYVDYNDNGTLDAGEPSAVTAADGTYTITDVAPGTWTKREVARPGWTQTYPDAPGYYEETFTSGATLTGNDFGNWQPAGKSGMKWNDLDGDGTKDAGEPGLAGWTIYVDYDDSGTLDAGEPSAVTGAGGTYTITDIVSGTWKVREVDQAGWTQTYPDAPGYYEETFTSGVTLSGNDFGNLLDVDTASTSGTKWNDLNGDGVEVTGEPGLAGWVVYVDYNDNGTLDADEPSAVTAADGTYTVTGVVSGTWKVREVAQAGWNCSFPASDDYGCYHRAEFTSGQPLTGNNFGNWRQAIKSGMKWNDLDGDGVKDAGEPGLEGWTIYVDYEDTGTLDEGDPWAVTAADGRYTIGGIKPGTFRVREVAQDGWNCSFPASDVYGCHHEETFTSGATLVNNDFGNWPDAELVSTSGMKWNDLNGNGDQDAGEPGLEGWRIYVDYDNDGTHDADEPSAVTAADGTYTITGIVPGTWKVREVAQAGWTQTHPDDYYEEDFASGATLTGMNFGNEADAELASTGGMKWNDLNGNGVKDAGEPGLGGWRIYVDYDDDGTHDAGEPSAVTAADGTYSITGVVSGTWKVREVAQAGWNCSFPTTGDGYGCYHGTTFGSGETLTGMNFGNEADAELSRSSGMKWNDLDGDGVEDPGEPGLAGWVIYVDYDDDGTLDAGEPSALTGAGGTYTITGVVSGTWKVREVAQAGWNCSFPTDSDDYGCYQWEEFTSGETPTGNDFGNWRQAIKSGMKFEDKNANSAKDTGEPGLEGWTIYVDYDNDGTHDAGDEPLAVTAADGTYTIGGIKPGTWKVREVTQAGWNCSFPTTSDDYGCYHEETFTSGATLANNDFGNSGPVAVGGVSVPVNKVDLLVSWPGLAALAALAVLGTALTRMRGR